MAHTSKAELAFKAKYPNAWATLTSGKPYEIYTVYAGDYPCATAHTRAQAFALAMDFDSNNLITPDASETRTLEVRP